MSDYFLGEIRLFSYPSTIPFNWLQCAGQTLPIAHYAALFSLLGTQFGGNGTTSFNLPDLRGRTPVGVPAAGVQGTQDGEESVTLNVNQIAPHNHMVNVTSQNGTLGAGANAFLATDAASGAPAMKVYAAVSATTPLPPATIQPAGSSVPHENRQPSLALVYCISTSGVFPTRG